MRACFSLLFCLLVAPFTAAEPLDEPGPEIIRDKNDAEWQTLFSALAGKGAVSATFTERRIFAVRKEPIEIAGDMRLVPERGLSLHYGERTIIVDAKGVLLRDNRGRSRVVKPDDRAPAATTLLLPVLRFDRTELEKVFVIHGVRAKNAWRLDFIPRESGDQDPPGRVVVRGVDEIITWIELRPKAGLRIEIGLRDVRTGVTFSAEELRRFFR